MGDNFDPDVLSCLFEGYGPPPPPSEKKDPASCFGPEASRFRKTFSGPCADAQNIIATLQIWLYEQNQEPLPHSDYVNFIQNCITKLQGILLENYGFQIAHFIVTSIGYDTCGEPISCRMTPLKRKHMVINFSESEREEINNIVNVLEDIGFTPENNGVILVKGNDSSADDRACHLSENILSGDGYRDARKMVSQTIHIHSTGDRTDIEMGYDLVSNPDFKSIRRTISFKDFRDLLFEVANEVYNLN